MEALDEGPEKIQIFYGDEPMRQRILQDLRDDTKVCPTMVQAVNVFMMYCSLVKAI